MSRFSEAEAQMIEKIGNDIAKKYWMAKWKGRTLPSIDQSDKTKLRSHIKRKYIEGRWKAEGPPPSARVSKSSVKSLFDIDMDSPVKASASSSSNIKQYSGATIDLNALFGDDEPQEMNNSAKVEDASNPFEIKSRREKKARRSTKKKKSEVSIDTLSVLDKILNTANYLWVEAFNVPSRIVSAMKDGIKSRLKFEIALHCIFGLASISIFLIFAGSASIAPYLCLLLECVQFWIVKNVTAPRLFRIRWMLVKPKRDKIYNDFFFGRERWTWQGEAADKIPESIRWLAW
eukprot:CAMPEP_0167755008 /NCGR_PEP_ID=MMETSP0110_2-20121227/8587_1 /TAXON_ID=629695 /ORGANISM="Gymnochlora sp., Strain CCMP2014" /LENGTH=288 /DNA_ID=CAMNT_0007640951 /DNA_START=98 /DNA_END=961 /DNA_ORIENTATION=+